ncbi:hypothetical protein Asp14428_57780 [Actinoplanes sp. NBRC 14428]|nr:hypothetical protein Asp14428_57780 [Actinoplanes sp. NBRC 14428]
MPRRTTVDVNASPAGDGEAGLEWAVAGSGRRWQESARGHTGMAGTKAGEAREPEQRESPAQRKHPAQRPSPAQRASPTQRDSPEQREHPA